jgi:DNA mismatch repair protein MutS2
LRPLLPELVRTLHVLVEMDTLWARARAQARWAGAVPELLDPEGEAQRGIAIVEGRHPLLLEARLARDGASPVSGAGSGPGPGPGFSPGSTPSGDPVEPVVPFSLELLPEERALVISGPNTGGKTVFLKAMGLLPLLAQSGIIPPVGAGTRLPILRNVFADIGDEQSIAQSLSTFSAHIANAREILAGAGPSTLVLMDELGTGTDPAEGAALGRAILETLVERGARAVVTSHLGQMKELDAAGSGIVNASLLFDPQRIRPTYQLQKGRPGRSYGMAIARRLGIPDAVLRRAEGYVDQAERETESLLASLEAKDRVLAEALADAARAREEARRLRDDLTVRSAELAARERSAEARAREDARRRLLEAREEVEAAIRDLRASDAETRAEAEREARRRVEEAARRQEREGAPSARPSRPHRGKQGQGAAAAKGGGVPSDPAGAGAPPSTGDRVRILGSGAKGILREWKGGRAVVEVGGLRLQVPPDELERITSPETPKERAARAAGGTIQMTEWTPRAEVQLLGLRVDEVDLALGRALDDAILGHLPELRIVHGKGTGAVRARVQELLRADPRVEGFRGGVHGEGGGGVTVAVLR